VRRGFDCVVDRAPSDATFVAMAGRTRTRATRWTEPRCLGCGAPADQALRELLDACHECGCDFSLRPPRSYAELEGLTPLDLGAAAAERRRRPRWSLSGVLFILVLAALVVLAASLDPTSPPG
jgi:hypothetical protein